MKNKLLEAAKNFAKKAQKFIDNFKESGKADLAALKNLLKENAKLLSDSLQADVITDDQYVNFSNIAAKAYADLKSKTTLTPEDHAYFTVVITQMLSEIDAIESGTTK